MTNYFMGSLNDVPYSFIVNDVDYLAVADSISGVNAAWGNLATFSVNANTAIILNAPVVNFGISVSLQNSFSDTITLSAPATSFVNVTYTLPPAPSVSGYILSSNTSGNMAWVSPSVSSDAWNLTGNPSDPTYFLGTTDATNPLVFKTNSVTFLSVDGFQDVAFTSADFTVTASGSVILSGATGSSFSDSVSLTFTTPLLTLSGPSSGSPVGKFNVLVDGSGHVSFSNVANPSSIYWTVGGNSGLSSPASFGTLDNTAINFLQNNSIFFSVDTSKNVALNTNNITFNSNNFSAFCNGTVDLSASSGIALNSLSGSNISLQSQGNVGINATTTVTVAGSTGSTYSDLVSLNVNSPVWHVTSPHSFITGGDLSLGSYTFGHCAITFLETVIQSSEICYIDSVGTGAGNGLFIGSSGTVQMFISSSSCVTVFDATSLTMPNMPNTSQANVVMYNSSTSAVTYASVSSILSSAWLVGGNTGLASPAYFGTTDAVEIDMYCNGVLMMALDTSGNVDIIQPLVVYNSTNFQDGVTVTSGTSTLGTTNVTASTVWNFLAGAGGQLFVQNGWQWTFDSGADFFGNSGSVFNWGGSHTVGGVSTFTGAITTSGVNTFLMKNSIIDIGTSVTATIGIGTSSTTAITMNGNSLIANFNGATGCTINASGAGGNTFSTTSTAPLTIETNGGNLLIQMGSTSAGTFSIYGRNTFIDNNANGQTSSLFTTYSGTVIFGNNSNTIAIESNILEIFSPTVTIGSGTNTFTVAVATSITANAPTINIANLTSSTVLNLGNASCTSTLDATALYLPNVPTNTSGSMKILMWNPANNQVFISE